MFVRPPLGQSPYTYKDGPKPRFKTVVFLDVQERYILQGRPILVKSPRAKKTFVLKYNKEEHFYISAAVSKAG